MQTTEVEKLRATLQAALDALPPMAEPEKPKPAWLGALSDTAHNDLCGLLPSSHDPFMAARFCLHAMCSDDVAEARHHLRDAARNIERALAELEGL